MKKIEVKVRYLFEGTYTVAADDRNEARTMVTRDCGLVLGGNIHTTLDDDEVDWEFDVHPDMQGCNTPAPQGRCSAHMPSGRSETLPSGYYPRWHSCRVQA